MSIATTSASPSPDERLFTFNILDVAVIDIFLSASFNLYGVRTFRLFDYNTISSIHYSTTRKVADESQSALSPFLASILEKHLPQTGPPNLKILWLSLNKLTKNQTFLIRLITRYKMW